MGMFIFVHLTPASCNWLCYGCHSNALSVALAAVILHSSAWLSSKTNKRKKERKKKRVSVLPPSACPEGQLTLSRWPGSFCPPSPILPFYSECIAKAASQSTLTCLRKRWRSFHPSHTLSNCCIGVACVTRECLTTSAQTSSLCLFVRASVLQSARALGFNLPRPDLSVIHSSCTLHKE